MQSSCGLREKFSNAHSPWLKINNLGLALRLPCYPRSQEKGFQLPGSAGIRACCVRGGRQGCLRSQDACAPRSLRSQDEIERVSMFSTNSLLTTGVRDFSEIFPEGVIRSTCSLASRNVQV